MSPSSVVDEEHIDAIVEIQLLWNRDELPGPAEPTLHSTPDANRTQAPFPASRESGRYFSEIIELWGCAKVRA
jgi:hypothetical protein